LKKKADDFFIDVPNKIEDLSGFNPLSSLGIKSKTLFSLISDKLLCYQSNTYFEDHLSSIPSNFIIFEFKEGQLFDFVLEFVSLYYLYIIFEKQLLALSNIKIPEIRSLKKESLEEKKEEVFRTKREFKEIVNNVFLYSKVFDSLNIKELKFTNEETRYRFLPIAQSVDKDSISQYFSDRICNNKKKIEEKLFREISEATSGLTGHDFLFELPKPN